MQLGRSEKINKADMLFNKAYHSVEPLNLIDEIRELGHEVCSVVLQGIFANQEPRDRVVAEPTSAFSIAVNQAIGLAVLAKQVESREVMLKKYGIEI